ncbi:unnamed protein product, partial [Symbiodinium pilosum]
ADDLFADYHPEAAEDFEEDLAKALDQMEDSPEEATTVDKLDDGLAKAGIENAAQEGSDEAKPTAAEDDGMKTMATELDNSLEVDFEKELEKAMEEVLSPTGEKEPDLEEELERVMEEPDLEEELERVMEEELGAEEDDAEPAEEPELRTPSKE